MKMGSEESFLLTPGLTLSWGQMNEVHQTPGTGLALGSDESLHLTPSWVESWKFELGVR